ncbi:MAG TPA: plasmid pRiA4b ORF-3 family protein, partial [Intrasporangium sp.]|nr:plasmid pRiA4b ORF-3 family protein [Intrasporangium sp.]
MSQPHDRRNPPIHLPDPPVEPVLLTIRISLRGTKPEVWRRFTIPGVLDLGEVHDAVQQVMGWTDSHLHHFSLGDPYRSPYFITEFDVSEGDEGTLETDARLDQVLHDPGDTLTYEYDFGDGWTHTLQLESVDPLPDPATSGPSGAAGASSAAYPLVCLSGERACPPEDVGGVGGYEEVAAWLRAGGHDAHEFDNGLTGEEMRSWLPDGWHPDDFDLDVVNAALAQLAPRDTETALGGLPVEVTQVISRLPTAARFEIDDWLAAPGWDEPISFTAEEATALMTPYRVLLDAVRDELELTAAGYLPPRVVETIYHEARLEEEWIGKGNREDQTWPVLDLRERSQRFGLIRKAKGRLHVTARGRRLLDDPMALLEEVLQRLALEGEDFEKVAGGLRLLAVAGGGGLGRDRWDAPWTVEDTVCRTLSIAGWQTGDGHPLTRDHVFGATRDLMDAVRQMMRCFDGDTETRADLERR